MYEDTRTVEWESERQKGNEEMKMERKLDLTQSRDFEGLDIYGERQVYTMTRGKNEAEATPYSQPVSIGSFPDSR